MRWPVAFVAGTLVFLASPVPVLADEILAQVRRPTPVAAFDGHVVWSDYDPATNAYFLTQRFQGVTARLPVKPRAVPFDVDVGRNADSTVATYSRCIEEPGGREQATGTGLTLMPQWSTGRGCDLYLLDLGTKVEARVSSASSARASEFLPAVHQGRIAFARVYEHRRGRAGKEAHLYVRPLRPSHELLRIRPGPRSRKPACAFPPPRSCRRVVEPGPTGLALSRNTVAYGWDSTDEGLTSDVYFQRVRAGRSVRHRVGRGSSGDAGSRELMAPHIDAEDRVAWILSLTGDLTLSEVARYAISSGKRRVAPLQPVAGEPVLRPVIAGAVNGSTATYLASGLIAEDELPCTGPFGCIANPGCSEAQPCELRTATLRFRPPHPR
jgi:hypothetical protein